MMRSYSVCFILLLVLAACTPSTADTVLPDTPTEVISLPATPTAELVATQVPPTLAPPTQDSSASLQASPTSVAISRPAWQNLPLIDARTGASFTFADFAGKTVFVEPMATWCTNCRQQLGNVSSASTQVDASQVVFIALSVETNISAADLAAYADRQGFGWTFAVMTPELLSELSAVFGLTIANPPSTPHFIIRPDGSTTELVTGIESSAQIVEMIQAASRG